MEYGYIYIIINEENGKRYVGQSTCYDKMNYYYGSGKIMKQALQKYGKDNFRKKVLIHCSTQAELDQYERGYIKMYNPEYNIALGGNTSGKCADETKEKIGAANRGENNGMFGKAAWNRGLAREKQPCFGKVVSKSTRDKISAAQEGKPSNSDGFSGKKHNISTKARMSASKLNREPLTYTEINKILNMKKQGIKQKDIAELFSVSPSFISTTIRKCNK